MSELKSAIIASATGPVMETEQGVFRRKYIFSQDFIGFSGHFPGYPILPAFIQVLTVLATAEAVKGPLTLLSIEKAKFKQEIYPDQEIEVECQEGVIKGAASLKATITTAKGLAASLVFTFKAVDRERAVDSR
jgi:3-hydroxyacyl-[acyl-carrier-protein] dehydratase